MLLISRELKKIDDMFAISYLIQLQDKSFSIAHFKTNFGTDQDFSFRFVPNVFWQELVFLLLFA